eukprot:gnl/TRDRNA2_/TRDRNA2_198339_c0_seq1.p1 gnl/TRDRNA2_/TRDRNA2_198339_c0~~gnl/TRDRNA2_/TRDRNA2_198339_c0_seq1.p1  ORF type:complete len:416 (-),score=65.41 gnl/TRDRNA2_/TRDRNA2_198339_c0_seq1:22-1269(-)
MAGNDGFIPVGNFKTKFKFNEGTRLRGAPRSQAGASVEMGWNEAMVAEAQGWGHLQLGHRPHHARPHLLQEGGHAPDSELHPDDGLTPQERAKLRVASRHSTSRASSAPSSAPCVSASSSGGRAPAAAGALPLREKYAAAPIAMSCADAGQARSCAATGSGAPPLPLREKYGGKPIAMKAGSAESRTEENPYERAREFNDALGGLLRAWRLYRSRLGSSAASSRSSRAKVVKIGKDVMYIGEVDAQQRPQGEGALLLADGAQHVGSFAGGRADGSGFYLTPKGLALQGSWCQNLRVGMFVAVNVQGEVWHEQYGQDGKKLSRTKAKRTSPPSASGEDAAREEALVTEPASECVNCGHHFHQCFNHAYACRQHKGGWVVDRDTKENEEQLKGIWSCCGSRCQQDLGCDFCEHRPKT